MTSLLRLPGGTSDFAELRAQRELYIDKTAYIADMLDGYGKYCFLARPRRFGKSLLVSTLEHLFRGHTDLFHDTSMQCRSPQSAHWTWPDPCPVIRLNMNDWHASDAASLQSELQFFIGDLCAQFGLALPQGNRSAASLFGVFLNSLYARRGKVVVLIDEYDYPLLHNLDNPALPEMQKALAAFYGVLKNQDAHLRFIFVTGVTRFACMSIFSGLNNLDDLSHDGHLHGMLGFTEREVRRCLTPYMTDIVDIWGNLLENVPQRLREYCNGYCFTPEVSETERVYNPYTTLSCLLRKKLVNYWMQSGTPFFLPFILKTQHCALRDIRHVDCASVMDTVIRTHRLAFLETGRESPVSRDMALTTDEVATLLFQTGYLTLVHDSETEACITDFPNLEVTDSVVKDLLRQEYQITTLDFTWTTAVCQTVQECNADAFQAACNRLMRAISSLEHTAREAWYQTLLHVALLPMQHKAHVQAEVVQHRGRADLAVVMNNAVVIMEIKMDDARKDALSQAISQEYHLPYVDQGKTAHVWGLTVGRKERQIVGMDTAVFKPTP